MAMTAAQRTARKRLADRVYAMTAGRRAPHTLKPQAPRSWWAEPEAKASQEQFYAKAHERGRELQAAEGGIASWSGPLI